MNPESDRQIADHVIRMHRYKHPNDTGDSEFANALLADMSEKDDEQSTPVYQKYDKLLHGNRKKQEIFSIPFIKKYILYAKFRIIPKLTEEVRVKVGKFLICIQASEYIKSAYANFRAKDDMKVR